MSMIISPPTIEHHTDRSVISTNIGGRQAWVSVDAPSNLRERLQPSLYPFAPLALMMAARSGTPLHVDANIDDGWWTNLAGAFLPLISALYDYPAVPISRGGAGEQQTHNQGDTGLMFSAGVDSFYSRAVLQKISARPQWFININAGAHDFDRACWQNRVRNVGHISKEEGVGLIVIDTNFHEMVLMDHVHSHVVRNLCAAFALFPAINRFVYSSAHAFPEISFVSAKKHGISYLDHTIVSTMTPSPISVAVLGWDASRIQKTKFIADDPIAAKHLDVCTNQSYQATLPAGVPINCGECGKCLRTIFTLEHFGKLNRFASVFCLKRFREDRDSMFAYLASQSQPVDRDVVELLLTKQSRSGVVMPIRASVTNGDRTGPARTTESLLGDSQCKSTTVARVMSFLRRRGVGR